MQDLKDLRGLTQYMAMHIMSSAGRAGGIGRRTGLKILWTRVRAGSIPAPGTMKGWKVAGSNPAPATRFQAV